MKIIILGGDGYLGWPTALNLSAKGHEVCIVDNYFKRQAAAELNCESLIPCPKMLQRISQWYNLTERMIEVCLGDITDYVYLSNLIKEFQPDAVIHYAEQPSAPYSMMSQQKAAFTIRNNLIGTLNIIYAIKEHAHDCHLVKLGTMGEYGTPDIDIEEGWLEIEHKGRCDKFLFPRQASSLYHTTKIQDTDLLWFYVRSWGIRVTDLMQGPVYGIVTEETKSEPLLMPSFHYDEIFGTVLNRFIVQSVAGYPLTIYGKGNQIRGYINIRDTIACVELSINNPAQRGELRIFNQITETFSVNDLAEKVELVGKKLGYSITKQNMPNPRVEQEEHHYNPQYTGLIDLGLKPHPLTDTVLEEMFKVVEQYKQRINEDVIFKGIQW